jgi:hypothetical protein
MDAGFSKILSTKPLEFIWVWRDPVERYYRLTFTKNESGCALRSCEVCPTANRGPTSGWSLKTYIVIYFSLASMAGPARLPWQCRDIHQCGYFHSASPSASRLAGLGHLSRVQYNFHSPGQKAAPRSTKASSCTKSVA